jgi:hypothetical protein
MGQQLQAGQFPSWRSGDGEQLWLSMLIEAMEEASRPELRSLPCDPFLLAAVSAHLARRHLSFQPAQLISAGYSPAICSRGRRPRSIPRSLASWRAM